MAEQDFDRTEHLKHSSVRVIGSLGLAERLLRETGSLKPCNSWMGITTSKKTYPDNLVASFADWASQNSRKFTLVIVDGMQIFNEMAIKGVNPHFLTDQQISHYTREIDDYQRSARKRMDELGGLAAKDGLANVDIILWSKLLGRIAGDDPGNRLMIDSFRASFYNSGADQQFDQDIANLTREKAAHILARAQGDKKTSEFAASLYAREQLVMIMTLATLASYGYKIKIGPATERAYDEIALDILKSGFGILRHKLAEQSEFKPFGAVYLQTYFHP